MSDELLFAIAANAPSIVSLDLEECHISDQGLAQMLHASFKVARGFDVLNVMIMNVSRVLIAQMNLKVTIMLVITIFMILMKKV
eukprot:gene8692-10286_t